MAFNLSKLFGRGTRGDAVVTDNKHPDGEYAARPGSEPSVVLDDTDIAHRQAAPAPVGGVTQDYDAQGNAAAIDQEGDTATHEADGWAGAGAQAGFVAPGDVAGMKFRPNPTGDGTTEQVTSLSREGSIEVTAAHAEGWAGAGAETHMGAGAGANIIILDNDGETEVARMSQQDGGQAESRVDIAAPGSGPLSLDAPGAVWNDRDKAPAGGSEPQPGGDPMAELRGGGDGSSTGDTAKVQFQDFHVGVVAADELAPEPLAANAVEYGLITAATSQDEGSPGIEPTNLEFPNLAGTAGPREFTSAEGRSMSFELFSSRTGDAPGTEPDSLLPYLEQQNVVASLEAENGGLETTPEQPAFGDGDTARTAGPDGIYSNNLGGGLLGAQADHPLADDIAYVRDQQPGGSGDTARTTQGIHDIHMNQGNSVQEDVTEIVLNATNPLPGPREAAGLQDYIDGVKALGDQAPAEASVEFESQTRPHFDGFYSLPEKEDEVLVLHSEGANDGPPLEHVLQVDAARELALDDYGAVEQSGAGEPQALFQALVENQNLQQPAFSMDLDGVKAGLLRRVPGSGDVQQVNENESVDKSVPWQAAEDRPDLLQPPAHSGVLTHETGKVGYTATDDLWNVRGANQGASDATERSAAPEGAGPQALKMDTEVVDYRGGVKWEGPDFDATKNELAIESIEFADRGGDLRHPAHKDEIDIYSYRQSSPGSHGPEGAQAPRLGEPQPLEWDPTHKQGGVEYIIREPASLEAGESGTGADEGAGNDKVSFHGELPPPADQDSVVIDDRPDPSITIHNPIDKSSPVHWPTTPPVESTKLDASLDLVPTARSNEGAGITADDDWEARSAVGAGSEGSGARPGFMDEYVESGMENLNATAAPGVMVDQDIDQPDMARMSAGHTGQAPAAAEWGGELIDTGHVREGLPALSQNEVVDYLKPIADSGAGFMDYTDDAEGPSTFLAHSFGVEGDEPTLEFAALGDFDGDGDVDGTDAFDDLDIDGLDGDFDAPV